MEPTVDLVTTERFRRPGFGTILGEGGLVGELSRVAKPSPKQAILDRFSRHGIRVMRRLTETSTKPILPTRPVLPPKTAATEEDPFSLRRRVLDQDLLLEDLNAPAPRVAAPLKLQPQKATPLGTDTPRRAADAKARLLSRVNAQRWDLPTCPLPKPELRFLFLLNTRLIQQRLQTEDTQRLDEAVQLPEVHALVTQVGGLQLAVRELLQHFWRAKVHDREYQSRVTAALTSSTQDIRQCMDQSFASRHTSLVNPRALCAPLLEAVKTALDRYEKLQALLAHAAPSASQ